MILYDFLGLSKERNLPKIDMNKIHKDHPEIYTLLNEYVKEKKIQYSLFKNIMSECSKDDFYRMYLELKRIASEYIYFIKNDTTGLIKIGMTTNPRNRLSSISYSLKSATGTEQKLRFIGIIYMTSSNMRDYEKMLHEIFSRNRKFGEWFDISEEEIINSYFSNSYIVNGVPFSIEYDIRHIPDKDFTENISDNLWEVVIIHKVMDICNKKHMPIQVCNVFVEMLLYFNINDIINIIRHDIKKQYVAQILTKANKEI